jgi:hypothetical protein
MRLLSARAFQGARRRACRHDAILALDTCCNALPQILRIVRLEKICFTLVGTACHVACGRARGQDKG